MTSHVQKFNKIGVVGLGLGYSLSYYLAHKGYNVIGVDINAQAFDKPRVDERAKGFIEQIKSDYDKAVNLAFTTEYFHLSDRELIMIFVSTPFVDGRISSKNVISALNSSLEVNKDAVYLILSTLHIGGFREIEGTFSSTTKLFYTPPMIRAVDFLGTFKNPPSGWQLIGYRYKHDSMILKSIVSFYKDLLDRTIKVIDADGDIVEKAKLVTNLMLSNKIIMANAIRDWLGLDAVSVCNIVGRDKRIGEEYFVPDGPAAGPCFPRDLLELEHSVESEHLREIVHLLNDINKTKELIR